LQSKQIISATLSTPHRREREKQERRLESSFTWMHRPKPRIPRWHVPTEAALFMYCASNYTVGKRIWERGWAARQTDGKIKKVKEVHLKLETLNWKNFAMQYAKDDVLKNSHLLSE